MMQQRLAVRAMASGEIDTGAPVAVLNDAFQRHAFLENDRTSVATLGRELHPASRLIQAFEDGELVGTGTITPALDEYLDETKFRGVELSRSLYFGMAAVRRERMGQGVGTRLLAESEQLAWDQGYAQVILTTIEEMGNVAYYQRFGYESVSMNELPAAIGD
jgi:predicted N-acetyltransferase YhbS